MKGEKNKNLKQCLAFKKLFKFCKWFKCSSATVVKRKKIHKHFNQYNSQVIPNNFLNQIERNLYLRTRETTEKESSREWTNITNDEKGLTVLYSYQAEWKINSPFDQKAREFYSCSKKVIRNVSSQEHLGITGLQNVQTIVKSGRESRSERI